MNIQHSYHVFTTLTWIWMWSNSNRHSVEGAHLIGQKKKRGGGDVWSNIPACAAWPLSLAFQDHSNHLSPGWACALYGMIGMLHTFSKHCPLYRIQFHQAINGQHMGWEVKKKNKTQNKTDPCPFQPPQNVPRIRWCNKAEMKSPAAVSFTMRAKQKPRSLRGGRMPKNVIPWQNEPGGFICHTVGHNDEAALGGIACRRRVMR